MKQAQEEAISSKKMLVITMGYPFLLPFILGAVILIGMFYFSGWVVIGTGYFATAAAFVGAACAAVFAVQNLAFGWGGVLLAVGSGLIMLGLIMPLFRGTDYLRRRHLLLSRELTRRIQTWRNRNRQEEENDDDTTTSV